MNSEIILVVVIVILAVVLGQKKNTKVFRPLKIVCLGDSLTNHTNSAICPANQLWPALLAARSGHTVINKGTSGNTSAQMLARFAADVVAQNPDICIIECGGNDAFNNLPYTTTMANIQSMVDLCTSNNITPIIMCCNPQFYSAEFVQANFPGQGYNENWEAANYLPATRTAEQALGLKYIDIYTPFLSGGTNNLSLYHTDKCHPNPAGNEVIYTAVVAALS